MTEPSPSLNAPYTQESNFEQAIHSTIAQFWQQREHGHTKTKDKVSLHWVKWHNPDHNKNLLVVNGRIECAEKYQELFYDLYQQGFNIYSYDHRGQGISDRLTDNKDIGHVGEFEDYLQDVRHLVKLFGLSSETDNYILAHSMGGCIATRYVQTTPNHPFKALSVSAPMYGVNLSPLMKPVAMMIAQLLTAFHAKPAYAPGHKPYYRKPFEGNYLSSCEIRYCWFRDLYEQKPEIRIGGPSTRWVWQGLMAAKQCIQQTRQVKIPLLLMQAEADEIVSNQAQNQFINKLMKTNSASRLEVLTGSRHELLFERDTIRNLTLDATIKFFNQHASE
ncbi:alpha/beta fold hydrolase [Vibrio maerlii]|uniref:alpha/beta fold hydrolase n=1 Tax=Vibrio maerlii TaxID=2231648 RepID=UPI000E3D02A0|nr:alpha/beta fold hydrolase [Vibrio maerlii]